MWVLQWQRVKHGKERNSAYCMQKGFQPNFLPLSTSKGAEPSVLLATSLNVPLLPVTSLQNCPVPVPGSISRI